MTNRQIENRIKKIEALEQQIKGLEAMVYELKEEVKEEMGSEEHLTLSHFEISYPVIIGTRLDTSRLKKELADVYKMYSVPTETRRFTYKSIA